MRRSTLVLMAACAALIACSQDLTDRERMVETRRLEGRLDSWVAHMNNAKVDSVLTMYDSSNTLILVGLDDRTAVGLDQVSQNLRDFFGKISFMNFVDQDPKIDVLSKSVAITVFRHSTDIVLANRTRVPVQTGPGSMVWVRAPGTASLWKIHTQHVVITVPPVN